MILSFVLVWVLAANWCFEWINEGLPNYVPTQNFWLVEVFYRFLRVVAPMCFLYPLTTLTWHWPTILIGTSLYLLAFAIKKIARALSYEEYL